MKFVLVFAVALIGFVAADVPHLRSVPDSATQGPNPQDIATPEPEYIDIDLPEPPRPAPRAAAVEAPPAHVLTSSGYHYKRPIKRYYRVYY